MNNPAMFVMPHYSDSLKISEPLLRRAVDSLVGQTHDHWRLVIVDDASPDPAVKPRLRMLAEEYGPRVTVLFEPKNRGQGVCRNIGIDYAGQHGCPCVLFIDADDACHPRWLEAVTHTLTDPAVDVVYTTLIPVDEQDRPVPDSRLTPSIRQILECHRTGPPEGEQAWKQIVTEFGYVNLTSATAVRTALAARFPFPAERISEDSHTWLRYSAGGGSFRFVADTPVRYRITPGDEGSDSRRRAGGKKPFYAELMRVDGEGFEAALELARRAGDVDDQEATRLRVHYHCRLAETLRKENQNELARESLYRANRISRTLTDEVSARFPALRRLGS